MAIESLPLLRSEGIYAHPAGRGSCIRIEPLPAFAFRMLAQVTLARPQSPRSGMVRSALAEGEKAVQVGQCGRSPEQRTEA